MNILVIDYRSKEKELFDSVSSYGHDFTLSRDYDEFLKHYDEGDYDICLVNIDNEEELKFVLHYMVHQNSQQKILFLYRNEEERCFFEYDCKLCREYQIKSLLYTTSDVLIESIENFEQLTCPNQKK